MWYQSWIEGIDGLASLYSFDILPDGSFSEIRLMAVNKQNIGMLMMNPDAPEFYPGIPYRNYWMDINFENFAYKCGSTRQPLYSYVNARGVWLKGFYIPVTEPDKAHDSNDINTFIKNNINNNIFIDNNDNPDNINIQGTVYFLYIITYSNVVETESLSQKSSEVATAVMNISIRLHETPDFYQAMASAVSDIKDICNANRCAIYTVDQNNRQCRLIDEKGIRDRFLETMSAEMNRTPIEIAEAWEKDLALSDCLILEDLKIIEERDPTWYNSMIKYDTTNLILYEIRYNRKLVGFIWAANFDTSKISEIKEALELSTFLIASIIENHQLVSRLEFKSMFDELTQINNRNAMIERIEKLTSGEAVLPPALGIVYADLNGLKAVNDNEGHDAGDKLLIDAAALLKTVFGDYEIYRAGGDEFVIFCPDITKAKLDQNVTRLRELTANSSKVSFAIGTEYCTGIYDIDNAMRKADDNMYADKEEYYRLHSDRDRRRTTRHT